MTAYFGMSEILNVKEGETVLINSGAGAVGSIAGQIAKIKSAWCSDALLEPTWMLQIYFVPEGTICRTEKGCRVVACAGSEEKCKWIKEDLGFDTVFNYKTVDLKDTLTKELPDGTDCFFDNVAGDFTTAVLPHMKLYGRIACCGAMSTYNAVGHQASGPYPYQSIIFKQLRIEGFMVRRWWGKWAPGQVQVLQWIKEGKLKYKECIYHGFETMPERFIALFEGSNFGKVIIKV